MNSIFMPFLYVICLLLLLLFPKEGLSGAREGLLLWYNHLLPSIFPFILLTNLLLNKLHTPYMAFFGILCGLPIGAHLVNQEVELGLLSKKQGNVLLILCNCTSPMFMRGYVLSIYLADMISPLLFFLSIYLPLFLYAILHGKTLLSIIHTRTGNSTIQMPEQQFEDLLIHASHVMIKIAVYLMFFSILIKLYAHLCSPTLPSTLALCSLEITNGIKEISTLPLSAIKKTALCAGLCSFGGFSSIFQTKSVLTSHGLSIIHYTVVKFLFGICSFVLLWIFVS